MNQKLLNSALPRSTPPFSGPSPSNIFPEYTEGAALNQLYGTQVLNQPPISPSLQPYINSNAGGILGVALQDALMGNSQQGQSYLDMLSGNAGFNYGDYGFDVGFNQPHPNPWGLSDMGGAPEDWNVNFRFPLNL